MLYTLVYGYTHTNLKYKNHYKLDKEKNRGVWK